MTDVCAVLERTEIEEAELSRSPLTHPIGCYAVDEAGRGAFHWFRDAGDLADFVLSTERVARRGRGAAERTRLRTFIRDLVGAPGQNRAVVARLNAIVHPTIGIRWCGTFQALCSSQSEFCREAREAFWDSNDEEECRAIPADKQPAFAATLATWVSR